MSHLKYCIPDRPSCPICEIGRNLIRGVGSVNFWCHVFFEGCYLPSLLWYKQMRSLSLSLFLSCSLSLQWKTGHFSPNTLISLAFLIFDLPEKCQNQSHNKDWKFHYLQLEVHIIILICINIGSTKFYKAYFEHICTL